SSDLFISSKKIMDSLKENPILGHITTFGGHPVSCAAGLASLKLILEKKLFENVPEKETLFRTHLVHPKIKEIRGIGLMLSLQLDSFEHVEKISSLCAKEGLIIDWFLHCETAMRIAPPLTISNKEIILACNIIKKAIDEAYKSDNN